MGFFEEIGDFFTEDVVDFFEDTGERVEKQFSSFRDLLTGELTLGEYIEQTILSSPTLGAFGGDVGEFIDTTAGDVGGFVDRFTGNLRLGDLFANPPPVPIPTVQSSLQDLISGRQAAAGSLISAIQGEPGTGGAFADISALGAAVPELGAAGRALRGTFAPGVERTLQGTPGFQAGPFDIPARPGLIGQAAAARGLDPGQIAPVNAELLASQFLPQQAQLAQQFGAQNLGLTGFTPVSGLNLSTLGNLQLQEAEFQAQLQAGQEQSKQAIGLSAGRFLSNLPSLLNIGT